MSRKILAVVFGIVVAVVIIIAIIGGLVLMGTVINLISIPHPRWFSITSVVAIIATIFVTSRLGSSFVAAPDAD